MASLANNVLDTYSRAYTAQPNSYSGPAMSSVYGNGIDQYGRIYDRTNDPGAFGIGGQYGPDSKTDQGGVGSIIDNIQPLAPNTDPRYAELAKQQQALAKTYGDKLGTNQSDLANMALQGTRRQLATTLQNVQGGANSRGLLYSGLNLGGQDAARRSAATTAANQISTANQTGINNLNQLRQNAINTGYGIAGVNTGQALNNINFQANDAANALRQSQYNSANAANFGAGIGKGLGYLSEDIFKRKSSYGSDNSTGNYVNRSGAN